LIKKNNGSVEYSNVVKVNVYCNGVHYATAFPNPAQNQIDFVINTGSQDENSEVKAQVLDMLGNVVMEQRTKNTINFIRQIYRKLEHYRNDCDKR
jgi:hypothetical protein